METFKDKLQTEKTKSEDVLQKVTIGNTRVTSESNVDFLRRDDLLRSARAYKIGSIVCITTGVAISLVPGIAYIVGAASEGAMKAGVCIGVTVACFGGAILSGKSIKLKNEAYEIAKADFLEMKLGDTNAYASLCSTYNHIINKTNVGIGFAFRF